MRFRATLDGKDQRFPLHPMWGCLVPVSAQEVSTLGRRTPTSLYPGNNHLGFYLTDFRIYLIDLLWGYLSTLEILWLHTLLYGCCFILMFFIKKNIKINAQRGSIVSYCSCLKQGLFCHQWGLQKAWGCVFPPHSISSFCLPVWLWILEVRVLSTPWHLTYMNQQSEMSVFFLIWVDPAYIQSIKVMVPQKQDYRVNEFQAWCRRIHHGVEPGKKQYKCLFGKNK